MRSLEILTRADRGGYMQRAPYFLDRMTYLAETGMVMYRSHMHKASKRIVRSMPAAAVRIRRC
jgi:hypothetical protein